MFNDQMDEKILDSVMNHTNGGELRAVAEQIIQGVRSGAALDVLITEAQYQRGLSFNDTVKIADMVEKMDRVGGLKSTLRKLRRQLNSFDHEDIEGMGKLISCIEGVEKQLDHKQKAKDDRKKKKEEKAQSAPKEEPASEELEPEAAVEVSAEPVPEGTMPQDPTERPDPESPQAPLTTGPEMVEHAVRFGDAMTQLKAKMDELLAEQETLFDIPELREQVQRDKPQLMEWLGTLPEKRALMELDEQKWSVLLSEPKPGIKAGPLLVSFEKRLVEEAQKGTESADKFLRMLKSMKSSQKYKLEKKPFVTPRPTPKPLQQEPHMLPPSEQGLGTQSALEDFDYSEPGLGDAGEQPGGAEEPGLLSGAYEALKRQVEPIMSMFDDALQNIDDLLDVAENQLLMQSTSEAY